jgi:hypothetical protein
LGEAGLLVQRSRRGKCLRPNGIFGQIDAACVVSVYRHAVEAGGYDPLAEKKKAMRNSRQEAA